MFPAYNQTTTISIQSHWKEETHFFKPQKRKESTRQLTHENLFNFVSVKEIPAKRLAREVEKNLESGSKVRRLEDALSKSGSRHISDNANANAVDDFKEEKRRAPPAINANQLRKVAAV